MVFTHLVLHFDFLYPYHHVPFLTLFDHHIYMFRCKRYKSDGFTIFYNNIHISNLVIYCLFIELPWSLKKHVTYMH